MKKKLFVLFTVLLGWSAVNAQTTTDLQAMIDQIKKEILDSLKKNPGLLDKGAPVDTGAPAQADPFTYGDFTWLNGNDRRHNGTHLPERI